MDVKVRIKKHHFISYKVKNSVNFNIEQDIYICITHLYLHWAIHRILMPTHLWHMTDKIVCTCIDFCSVINIYEVIDGNIIIQ